MLAAGGRSRYIHLWSLDTRRLLRIIEMPTKVTTVKQLEFLPDSFQDGFDQVCCLPLLKRKGLCSVMLLSEGVGGGVSLFMHCGTAACQNCALTAFNL